MFPFDDVIMSEAYIDGLVQERRNSIADAMELRLSCTNPSMCDTNSSQDEFSGF